MFILLQKLLVLMNYFPLIHFTAFSKLWDVLMDVEMDWRVAMETTSGWKVTNVYRDCSRLILWCSEFTWKKLLKNVLFKKQWISCILFWDSAQIQLWSLSRHRVKVRTTQAIVSHMNFKWKSCEFHVNIFWGEIHVSIYSIQFHITFSLEIHVKSMFLHMKFIWGLIVCIS